MIEEAKAEILVALKKAFRGPSFKEADLEAHPDIRELLAKAGITLDELVGEHTGFVSGTKVMPIMLEKGPDGAYSFFWWRPNSMPANHEEWCRAHGGGPKAP